MPMEYVKAPFEASEFEALVRRTDDTLRLIPNEVRFIVREALERDGLLTADEPCQPAASGAPR
jgi:hypothetical protein